VLGFPVSPKSILWNDILWNDTITGVNQKTVCAPDFLNYLQHLRSGLRDQVKTVREYWTRGSGKLEVAVYPLHRNTMSSIPW